MRQIGIFTALLLSVIQAFSQMIINKEGITPENICTPKSVYYFLPVKPHPVEPIDTIRIRLNKAISFVGQNPDFKANPGIQVAVNCKGEYGGGIHIISSSGDTGLDNELMKFLAIINTWTPGKLK